MDNLYLLDLINEAEARGGGMLLSLGAEPAAVVLSIDKYNELLQSSQQPVYNSKQVDEEILKFMDNKNKKVLVTGGAGYIGGHLVARLVAEGYEVVVLDNLSTGKNGNVHSKAKLIEGDLCNEAQLKEIFSQNDFGAVFHMAASLEVGESVKYPEKYFENNVGNTIKLLKAMGEAGVKKIIFSSTAAVYGQSGLEPLTETSALKPTSPYGASKLLAERVIKYYCDFMGFSAFVFRYFNACGFADGTNIVPTHQSHLIYNVLEVAKGSRQVLEVYGNDYPTFDGTGVRDYVHVDDIAGPHILALSKMAPSNAFEVYNIGTSRGHSVLEIVTRASEVLNKIIPMEIKDRREGDAISAVADNSKLVNQLGYQLKHSDLDNIVITSWEVMSKL